MEESGVGVTYLDSVSKITGDAYEGISAQGGFLESELQSPTKCKFGLSGFRSFTLIYRAAAATNGSKCVDISNAYNKKSRTTFCAIVKNYGDRLAVCGSWKRWSARVLSAPNRFLCSYLIHHMRRATLMQFLLQ